MADVIRIAPELTDESVVEWIGDGATTQQVALRFAWRINDARRKLEKLHAKGLINKHLTIERLKPYAKGGQHLVWSASINKPFPSM